MPQPTRAAGRSTAPCQPPRSNQSKYQELFVGYGPVAEPMLSDLSHAFTNWQKCRAFIGQLRRQFGPEPKKCNLFIRQDEAGGGVLYNVHLRYPSRLTAALKDLVLDYVLTLQDQYPEHWDETAREELGLTPVEPVPTAPTANSDGKGIPEKVKPVELTDRQLRILKKTYVDIGRTSDQLLLSQEAAEQLQALFTRRARKEISAPALVARIIVERKRGEWPTLRSNGAGEPASHGKVATASRAGKPARKVDSDRSSKPKPAAKRKATAKKAKA
jgi:hypothetical protein